MESLSVLVPFASLIVGWYLNEISKEYQMSRVRRAHIGRALLTLLELRAKRAKLDIFREIFSPSSKYR